jgi:hypothetical protein
VVEKVIDPYWDFDRRNGPDKREIKLCPSDLSLDNVRDRAHELSDLDGVNTSGF